MSIREKILALQPLLENLLQIDLGYPHGSNLIHHPESSHTVLSRLEAAKLLSIPMLSDFYVACDGAKLPDLFIGYYINRLDRVIAYYPDSDPAIVKTETQEIPVLHFGTTGGGDFFVIERSSGQVWFLPQGPLHNGRYDGTYDPPWVVASSLSHFIDRLIDDLTAFIHDEHDHNYLVRR